SCQPSPDRTLARRGLPTPLGLGWLPRVPAPGRKSPEGTRSGPHRDDSRLRMVCGCASLVELSRAGLRTAENPAESRALRPRASPAAAPAQPGISFETRLLRAGALAGAWLGPVLAAHYR